MRRVAPFYISYFFFSFLISCIFSFAWESVSVFIYGFSIFLALFLIFFLASQWIWKAKLSNLIFETQNSEKYGKVIWLRDPTPWMRPVRSWGSSGAIFCTLGCALFWDEDQFEKNLQDSWVRKNRMSCVFETNLSIFQDVLSRRLTSPTHWISWILFGWLKSLKMKLQRG